MLQVWLQEFVWTREQHQSLQKQRKLSGQVEHATGHALPLFCMEQAFSALYWSGLVYDSHEVHQRMSDFIFISPLPARSGATHPDCMVELLQLAWS